MIKYEATMKDHIENRLASMICEMREKIAYHKRQEDTATKNREIGLMHYESGKVFAFCRAIDMLEELHRLF